MLRDNLIFVMFLKKGFTQPLLSPSKELRGSPSVDRKNYNSYNRKEGINYG